MANTIDRQVLVNGSRNYVVKFTATSDGAAGDLSAVRVNSVTGDIGTANSVEVIEGACSGCTATLLFDATTDVPFYSIADGSQVNVKLIHPIVNNSGSGKTGDILITTGGFSTAGDSVTVVLKIRKK